MDLFASSREARRGTDETNSCCDYHMQCALVCIHINIYYYIGCSRTTTLLMIDNFSFRCAQSKSESHRDQNLTFFYHSDMLFTLHYSTYFFSFIWFEDEMLKSGPVLKYEDKAIDNK